MAAMHVSEALARFHAAGLTRGTEITKPVLAEFVLQLGECDATMLEAATTEWISVSPWLPKPAELLAIVRRLESESPSQPAEPEHWRRDAYRCQTCRDTGYVTVWHPTAMQSAIWHVRGKIARERLRLPTCDARCDCTIGRSKPSGKPKRKLANGFEPPEPVTYRSPPMIHVDPALDADQQIETLLAWARDWQPKPQAGDRYPEFDEF